MRVDRGARLDMGVRDDAWTEWVGMACPGLYAAHCAALRVRPTGCVAGYGLGRKIHLTSRCGRLKHLQQCQH